MKFTQDEISKALSNLNNAFLSKQKYSLVLEELVDYWHDSDIDIELYEYLGMDRKQYSDWLTSK